MEPLWSPVVATGGNQRQIGWLSEPHKNKRMVRRSVAPASGRWPPLANDLHLEKEGVDDYPARLYALCLRAVRALVAAAAGACLADRGEMIVTDSSRGPSAAVPEARLRQVPEVVGGAAP